MIFPLAAFAYGFICTYTTAQFAGTTFDFNRELEIGANCPNAEHVAFAQLLKASISALVIAQQAAAELADEGVILRLRDDRAIEIIGMFGKLKDQIGNSKLSAEAKKELISHVDVWRRADCSSQAG